jgi:hypothetical protein
MKTIHAVGTGQGGRRPSSYLAQSCMHLVYGLQRATVRSHRYWKIGKFVLYDSSNELLVAGVYNLLVQ